MAEFDYNPLAEYIEVGGHTDYLLVIMSLTYWMVSWIE